MAYNEVIVLRNAETVDIDELGDQLFDVTERKVFARCCSIGMKEFYQAAAIGLKPEIKFIIADAADYQGELALMYHGITYKILRTYQAGTELEIVCYKDANRTAQADPPVPLPADPEA